MERKDGMKIATFLALLSIFIWLIILLNLDFILDRLSLIYIVAGIFSFMLFLYVKGLKQYARGNYKSTKTYFILIGIISFPIGLLAIFAGIQIDKIAHDIRKELNKKMKD